VLILQQIRNHWFLNSISCINEQRNWSEDVKVILELLNGWKTRNRHSSAFASFWVLCVCPQFFRAPFAHFLTKTIEILQECFSGYMERSTFSFFEFFISSRFRAIFLDPLGVFLFFISNYLNRMEFIGMNLQTWFLAPRMFETQVFNYPFFCKPKGLTSFQMLSWRLSRRR